MRDLVVAGGGPVGLATALYAARAGLDVVVREPRRGAVDKACGEGLMPGAVTALADLGVDPPGRRLDGIRYVDGSHRAEATFRRGPGRGVRRTVLHSALQAAVAEAGVDVEHRAVGSVVHSLGHLVVDGQPSRYLVAADGLHSPLRRLLGLGTAPAASPVTSPPKSPKVRRYGLRCHAATAPWTPFVEVHWSPFGEAYVTPVGDDLVGVAVLSSERRGFTDLLATFPELERRLRGLDLSPVLGAGPLRQQSAARVQGRALLVGDAAGYVDALTGEGIAIGLAQARAAVAAITLDDPDAYEQSWRRVRRKHDLLTHGLLAATRRPVLRRRLVPTAALLPALFQVAVDQMARPA
ncbi:NAD(P)/FAD-dependent oxidoreductase [soil metagenome]